MKDGIQNILGLDLGTNSIGWALVEIDHDRCLVSIKSIGSRIIPMDPSEISKFENGAHMSSAAATRREKRQPRRMNERFILRRDRLNCILDIYKMLPDHYRLEIDFETPEGKRCGKLKRFKEPKIAYKVKTPDCSSKHKKYEFLFEDSYREMCADLTARYGDVNKRGIPKDWTLYYLRQKALNQPISMLELAWVLHSFNQKRGYEKVDGTDDTQSENEIRTVIVTEVVAINDNVYHITVADVDNNAWTFSYIEESAYQVTHVGDFKQLEIVLGYDKEGIIDNNKTKYVITELRDLKLVENKRDEAIFFLTFENKWEQEAKAKNNASLKAGNTYTFICKTEYKENGEFIKRILTPSLESDKKANWAYIKLDTETRIEKYNHEHGTKGVASYIYHHLLSQEADKLHNKIIGGMVESVERKYYHDEVVAILKKQSQFHDKLNDENLYEDAVCTLYPHNEKHRGLLMQQTLTQLLADDVLFYQRELKSKKSEISDCPFESYKYEDNEGNEKERKVKVAHRSNPVFQEFRLWKFISQLRIFEEPTEEHASRLDVTEQYLTYDAKAALFEDMMTHKTIKQTILSRPYLHLPNRGSGYTWNYESDHEEKGNETHYEFMWRLRRIKDFDWQGFLSATHNDNGKSVTNEYMLWHFFYAVKRCDQKTKGLATLVERLLGYAGLDASLVPEITKNLITFTGFKNEYAAYSEKALLKLLPLMRCGKYWNSLDVEKITGVVDDVECQGMIERGTDERKGAVDIVYADKLLALHSERWNSPQDIIHYLKHSFKSNSLKNPVVEKVVREMLYIVHDVWQEQLYANSGFHFSEIHVELGRELQKSPKQKEKANIEKLNNEKANKRAELILREMQLEAMSPFLREKYRIYEDCLLSKIQYDKKDADYEYKDKNGDVQKITKAEIEEIKKASDVNSHDIAKYRMWLDNQFSSPYTGQPIKFTDLFDGHKYQRDHVLPRERVTLNALCNLVMCEAAVNKTKGALTGMQFIKQFGGRRVKGHLILTETQYRDWVDKNIRDPKRREIMLSEHIPSRYLQAENQLNNTRYISRLALQLLSRIVREPEEKGAISKHMLPVNGSVTAWLRKDWKLGEVWNELIAPRFLRMNREIEKLTGKPSTLFGAEREVHGKKVFIPDVPEQYREDFEKKRIDHRHHALDALVVALTETGHIQYINNKTGDTNTPEALIIRKALKKKYTFAAKKDDGEKEVRFRLPLQYEVNGNVNKYKYLFDKAPTPDFKKIVLKAMTDLVVTFKQTGRIMSPRQNLYLRWDEEKGRIVTTSEENLKDESKWCIRKPVSADTIYGQRSHNVFTSRWKNELQNLPSKLPTEKENAKQKLEDIVPDKGIRTIISAHIDKYKDVASAFTEESISQLNKQLIEKGLYPIQKLALLENSEMMHPLSINEGVKSRQFVRNAKGGNTSCYFYGDHLEVLTLDMLCQGQNVTDNFAFKLLPNDLVYIPTETEVKKAAKIDKEQASFAELGIKKISSDSIYKMIQCRPKGNQVYLYCMPSTMSKMILSDGKGISKEGPLKTVKGEIVLTNDDALGPNSLEGILIKSVCWKVIMSRTGHILNMVTQSGLVITQ